MGRFRSDNRSGGFGRDRGRSRDSDSFSGRSGGRGGFRGLDSRRSERRSPEMHNVVCDKCGKECQVPFKPTGDKPVFCSDCFRKNDGSRESSGATQSGISQEQFKQINAKLDKIIQILETDLEEE